MFFKRRLQLRCEGQRKKTLALKNKSSGGKGGGGGGQYKRKTPLPKKGLSPGFKWQVESLGGLGGEGGGHEGTSPRGIKK